MEDLVDELEFRFHIGSTSVCVVLSAENVGGSWALLIKQIKETDSGIDLTNVYDHSQIEKAIFHAGCWEIA